MNIKSLKSFDNIPINGIISILNKDTPKDNYFYKIEETNQVRRCVNGTKVTMNKYVFAEYSIRYYSKQKYPELYL